MGKINLSHCIIFWNVQQTVVRFPAIFHNIFNSLSTKSLTKYKHSRETHELIIISIQEVLKPTYTTLSRKKMNEIKIVKEKCSIQYQISEVVHLLLLQILSI